MLNGNVMAQENALSYRVSRNGSAGDWYWEVISDEIIINRGLAPTSAQAPRRPSKLLRLMRSGGQAIPRDP
jgi:hypothetical protein